MMDNIIIGKHALESLTRGMYSDSLVIFREYIQNSADAIDEAIRTGILKPGKGKIEVQLSPIERTVVIKDNGIGILSSVVEKTLINIGNSKKQQGVTRGFRGIGRLAALSYCGELIFETSSAGEKIGSRVSIDARKLSSRLMQTEDEDVSAEEVIQEVYTVEHFQEQENSHFFNVIIKDIDNDSEIINYDLVYDYLVQNVPATYNTDVFKWGEEIKSRLKSEGYLIPEYNIFLIFAGNALPIFKAYTDNFTIDKKGNTLDEILDISIFKLTDSNGDISAYCWFAETNYLGSIHDKSIKGLRLRKGNILIGDGQTLNVCFKDARFNGWVLGEVFVVDPCLIPNARRDNFEKNSAYFIFTEQLRNIAATIIKNIRHLSVVRNAELSRLLDEKNEIKNKVDSAFDHGEIKSEDKAVLQKNLFNTKNSLKAFSSNNDLDSYNQDIAFEEIDMLIGKLQGTTAYKSLNAMSNLNKEEKVILERVFDSIKSTDVENAESLINAILNDFSEKS